MKLVIVESPKKCETIGRYLGQDFKVMASTGHIRDLSTHGKGGLGIDIEKGFSPDWVIYDGKKAIVAKLREAVRESSDVYLATDPDREGEAISWHLAQVLHLPVASTKRLQFHEITKPAILEAMEHPKTIDTNLVEAQESRRAEDRIIGFKISSILQRKTGLRSAGRVQSATLGMIVDRQKAIDAFVPEEYWTIEVSLLIEGKLYKAALSKIDGKPAKIKTKEEADKIVARIPSMLSLTSQSTEEKQIYAKPAFTTSTMQQEAFSKFHFSNAKTQATAQKLYEGKTIHDEHVGLITYMRTDSTRISPEFYARHAVPFITETYGKEYVGFIRKGKDSKNIQDAHEAIRPTGTHRTPEEVAKFVTPDEAKLYRLIYCRAMASLMAPKKVEKTSIVLSGNGLDFSLSGSRTLFKGFSAIYGEFDEEEEGALPAMKEGLSYSVSKVDPQQKFTKPEPAYNEATIVRAMEEKGIGRPSTYATTIENLIKQKYITAVKGVLAPTEEGKRNIDVLREYFPDIVLTSYTGSMETRLDKVESGETNYVDTMNDFYWPFLDLCHKAEEMLKKLGPVETGNLCPVCGRPLVLRKNKAGQEFEGCSGFPACTYIKRPEKPAAEFTGENCPDCGAPLVYKMNKKGEKFIGCSAFPKCHYTASLQGKTPAKKAAPITEADWVKPCPSCGDGHLVIKQGKRKKFLGCTNFPRCRYHEWIDSKKER